MRTGIAHGEYDVARQLALDVGVVLQRPVRAESPVAGRKCPGKVDYSRRSIKNWKSARDADGGAARPTGRGAAGWGRNWAAAELDRCRPRKKEGSVKALTRARLHAESW